MRKIKKTASWLIGIPISVYILICTFMFFGQEGMIFHPTKLEADYNFQYQQKFEELNITCSDGKKLNALLFRNDSAKGLVFYLHGNAGALDTWGNAAKNYLAEGFDFFILDYPGFGKSTGEIKNEEQFFSDMQSAYDAMKKRYDEKKIVVIGYSIGTGPAAMIASRNHPKTLILQAPYYSLVDLTEHIYPFVPAFLLKYKFHTDEFIQKIKMPLYVFHGDADRVIYYGSSLKLKTLFKSGDKLFILPGKGHSKMNDDEIYLRELKNILASTEN